jgi:hypothetical protein
MRCIWEIVGTNIYVGERQILLSQQALSGDFIIVSQKTANPVHSLFAAAI